MDLLEKLTTIGLTRDGILPHDTMLKPCPATICIDAGLEDVMSIEDMRVIKCTRHEGHIGRHWGQLDETIETEWLPAQPYCKLSW